MVNKDMAYCADCAVLLHLGESKESRLFKDFQGIEGEAPREDEAAPVAGSGADHWRDIAGRGPDS